MNKRVIFSLVTSSILFSISSCKEEQKVVKPIKIEFKKEGKLTLYKSTTDSIISRFDIEIADNDYEIQTGLMHRYTMENDNAMLFIFSDMNLRSFYMKNTHIPLDIIFFNSDKQIVSIQKNAKPLDETSLSSILPAQYVLEVNSGLAESLNLEIGDRISYSQSN